jgi:hypothetical protein
VPFSYSVFTIITIVCNLSTPSYLLPHSVSAVKIASVLNIRFGGVFCVFSDGISGDLMAALRLLATDGGECVVCVLYV